MQFEILTKDGNSFIEISDSWEFLVNSYLKRDLSKIARIKEVKVSEFVVNYKLKSTGDTLHQIMFDAENFSEAVNFTKSYLTKQIRKNENNFTIVSVKNTEA